MAQLTQTKINQSTQIVELEAQINILKHKLEHYDKLEEEVDKMVLSGENQNKILNGLPTSTARRTSQAVFLARTLNEKTVELKNVFKRLKDREIQIGKLNLEIERLKELNRQYVTKFEIL